MHAFLARGLTLSDQPGRTKSLSEIRDDTHDLHRKLPLRRR